MPVQNTKLFSRRLRGEFFDASRIVVLVVMAMGFYIRKALWKRHFLYRRRAVFLCKGFHRHIFNFNDIGTFGQDERKQGAEKVFYFLGI